MWDCVGECLRLKFENTSHCQVCQLVVGLVPIFQFSCLSVWSWSWKIRFLEWRLHSIVKCVTLVVDFAGVSRYQGISVLLSFCISDFVRLDFKTEDYIPSSSVSHSDIRNSPTLPPFEVSDYITRDCQSTHTFIIVILSSSLYFVF